MHLEKIAQACAVECERQQVWLTELGCLLTAYSRVFDDDDAFREVDYFLLIGSIVDPGRNRFGFRTTPVTFQSGGDSATPFNIPRLMSNLASLIESWARGEASIDTDAMVKEFLWIHPFRDGNGRVAFLLQNFLDGTLDDPQPLRRHF